MCETKRMLILLARHFGKTFNRMDLMSANGEIQPNGDYIHPNHSVIYRNGSGNTASFSFLKPKSLKILHNAVADIGDGINVQQIEYLYESFMRVFLFFFT